MTWGIIVYESAGRFYPFLMADDSLYDGMKKNTEQNFNFVSGRKGITDNDVDDINDEVCKIVIRANDEEFSLEKLKKDLESIL